LVELFDEMMESSLLSLSVSTTVTSFVRYEELSVYT